MCFFGDTASGLGNSLVSLEGEHIFATYTHPYSTLKGCLRLLTIKHLLAEL